MLESQIQAKMVSRLHDAGWFTCKINLCSVCGFPDIIAIKDGTTVFIECKAPGKNPRKLQDVCHRKLREQHVPVVIHDGSQEILKQIFDAIYA